MTSKWPMSSLANVCEVKRGETITRSQTTTGTVPVIAGGLNPAYFHGISNRSAGAITVSGSGANAGSVAMWDEDIWASDCSTVISNNPELSQKFVYYFLKANESYIKTELRQGAAQPHVYAKDLAVLEIPLPPLDEQKRIVAKLDEALGALDQVTENSKSALAQIDALWKSLLNQEFNTDPVFQINAKSNWSSVVLAELFDIGSSKRVLKSDWRDSGVPFYRGREISALAEFGTVDNDLFISAELYSNFAQKYGIPSPGDLMMTAIGTVGNVWIVEDDHPFYFKDASVLWLAKRKDCSSEFIRYWMKSQAFFDQLKLGSGATVDSLTIGRLEGVRVPHPPLDAQKQIVARLDSLRIQIEELRKTIEQKLAEAASLRSSILRAAFAGEF